MLLDQAPDVEVVSEVGDGSEALAQIETLKPDVAAEVGDEVCRYGYWP